MPEVRTPIASLSREKRHIDRDIPQKHRKTSYNNVRQWSTNTAVTALMVTTTGDGDDDDDVVVADGHGEDEVGWP